MLVALGYTEMILVDKYFRSDFKGVLVRICLLVVFGVVALFPIGCERQSDFDKNGVVSSPVSSPSKEELQIRASEAYVEVGAEEWSNYYDYQSPRLRRKRWPYGLELAQPCSPQKFAVEMDVQMAKLKDVLGVNEGDLLTLRVNSVIINGIRGVVHLDILYEGELVSFGDETTGEDWIFLDGQWWREDDKINRCPIFESGGSD